MAILYKQKWYEETNFLISQQRKQDHQTRINDGRERDNAYRDANKERINANQRIRHQTKRLDLLTQVVCECGCVITR